MKANQADFSVRTLCHVLRLSHSGFHEWVDGPANARAQAHAALLEHIEQAHRTLTSV